MPDEGPPRDIYTSANEQSPLCFAHPDGPRDTELRRSTAVVDPVLVADAIKALTYLARHRDQSVIYPWSVSRSVRNAQAQHACQSRIGFCRLVSVASRVPIPLGVA